MATQQHQTPYAETEALLAVLEDDRQQAVAIVGDMTVREQGELQQTLRRLIRIVDETAPRVL